MNMKMRKIVGFPSLFPWASEKPSERWKGLSYEKLKWNTTSLSISVCVCVFEGSYHYDQKYTIQISLSPT